MKLPHDELVFGYWPARQLRGDIPPPVLPIRTFVFSSKVPQRLFDAACSVPQLEALSVKWSAITSLVALSQATSLRALFLGSLTQLEMLWLVSLQVQQGGLNPLHSLRNLASLRTTIRASSTELRELCAAVPTLKHFQPVG